LTRIINHVLLLQS